MSHARNVGSIADFRIKNDAPRADSGPELPNKAFLSDTYRGQTRIADETIPAASVRSGEHDHRQRRTDARGNPVALEP